MIKFFNNHRIVLMLIFILAIGLGLRIYTFSQLTTNNKFTFSTDPLHYYQQAIMVEVQYRII
jgi:hypothetical protein